MDLKYINDWLEHNRLDKRIGNDMVLLTEYYDSGSKQPTYVDELTFAKDVESELFDCMMCSNLSTTTNQICFDKSATTLIDKLLKKYVTDRTLIVTSGFEHINVRKLMQEHRYVYKFELEQIEKHSFSKLINILSDNSFDRVVIYFIGTQISTGVYHNQCFLQKLKQTVSMYAKDTIFVLDDVQGMYLAPRDYSLFDYVIGTAHSVVLNYDMGILIGKKEREMVGHRWYNHGLEYIKRLKLVLASLPHMLTFNVAMYNTFGKELADRCTMIYTHNIPTLFSIQIGKRNTHVTFTPELRDQLFGLHCYVEGVDEGECDHPHCIRLRAQEFVQFPELVTQGLSILQKYIQAY